MGKPYSLDLRKRVVAAVLVGGMSRNQAAQHFGVGISTAINWVKRQQETGNVAPGKMGSDLLGRGLPASQRLPALHYPWPGQPDHERSHSGRHGAPAKCAISDFSVLIVPMPPRGG
jgi:transposase-like protein